MLPYIADNSVNRCHWCRAPAGMLCRLARSSDFARLCCPPYTAALRRSLAINHRASLRRALISVSAPFGVLGFFTSPPRVFMNVRALSALGEKVAFITSRSGAIGTAAVPPRAGGRPPVPSCDVNSHFRAVVTRSCRRNLSKVPGQSPQSATRDSRGEGTPFIRGLRLILRESQLRS